MRSRLWFKAFAFVFFIVAGCTLAIALYTIPLIRDISYSMEEKYAISLLDRVQNLVEAKHQEIEGYRRAALEAKKQELRHITQVVGGYLEAEEQAARQGKIDPRAARQRAINYARRFIYGNDDYVWISDFQSVLISHPDPRLFGADFSQKRDVRGDLIVPPMVQVARERGEGFTSYWWNRLGRDQPAEKLTYSRLFKPWDWVYGTGVYIDDIEDEVQRRKQVLIGQLREMMSQITIGDTGYMYIFDVRKNMIIHPNKQLEGKTIEGLKDPVSGRPMAELLVAAARTPGVPLYYKWDRPEEPGNYVYDKLSWVRYFPGFDWYIASSVYQDELRAGSRSLSWRIAGIAFLIFVLALVVGYIMLKKLVRPIEQLSSTALKVRRGEFDVRSGVRAGDDEIGILAREFDGMVATMADHVNILDAKVREKTSELTENLAKLEQANRQIMDSMEYASTIQRALLPPTEDLEAGLAEHFVLFRPKDSIGGDLYLFLERPEGNILAVMDCTGHGVPGAIMTTIAATSLRRALHELGAGDPARLLSRLNWLMRRILGQERAQARSDDGLDMGLCLLPAGRADRLIFAGARLSLFVAQGGRVEEFKGDRQSLGYRSSDPDFVYQNLAVDLAPEAMCYIATDGLLDQAGGAQGFPFGKARFRDFAARYHDQACARQKYLLESTLAEYQRQAVQRDDITVVGFRLSPMKMES
ncbi:MAG: cache domain-containing protein [Pseudomonadota bacterium]